MITCNRVQFSVGSLNNYPNVSHHAIREYRPRENVTFLENGTKIFATNPKSFVFLREMSVGDPEVDLLTTPNIPVIVSLHYM